MALVADATGCPLLCWFLECAGGRTRSREGGIRTHDTEVRVAFGLGSRAVASHFLSDSEFPRKNRSVPAVKPGR
jgi:hypothetical protein